jgi:DNA-binding NarL/FixJ family response regulator
MAPTSVLLVDDNPTLLRILRRFLGEEEGLLVVGTAGSGEEALGKARELQPQVILLDLAMPGMDGLNTIPRLRSVLPGVGIIVLTVLEANGYREAALAAGADDFVTKADLSTDLVPAIHRLSQGRRSFKGAPPPPAHC